MIGWVRPRIVVPVHGEALHMAEHAALARRLGVPKVVTCRDGDLVRLAPGDPAIIDEVPAGRLYKDGSLLVGAQERTVADRRRLSFAGIVSVALTLSDRGELVAGPRIDMNGIPDADAPGRRSWRPCVTPCSMRSNRCPGRAAVIPMRLPNRCGAPSVRRSARPGARSPYATSTC